MSAMTAEKKLRKDLMKLEKDPPPGISAYPSEENILDWDAVMCGPDDTPFEGGNFRLKLKYSSEYPMKAPTVWFYSKMFHPNVYSNGKICLDILEEPSKWNSDYDVAAVLCGIQSMLGDPNPNSPANGEANGLYLREPENYIKRVQEIVELSNADDDVISGALENQNDTSDAANELASFDWSEVLRSMAEEVE